MKYARLTQMKAMRLKCLDCCCGNAKEVRECEIESCSLHPYRFGRGPKDPKELSGFWACGDGKL